MTADFTGAVQGSVDISRNRLAFSLGVDAGLKTSFLAMLRQAQERIDLYLYLFRRAYMYEFCESAGQEVAELNVLTSRIDRWLRDVSAARGVLGGSWRLKR